MGLLDDAKDKLSVAVGKAKVAVDEHAEQIEGGIDKVAGFVDDRTGHKHTDQIDKAAGKAKTLVEKQKRDEKPTDTDDDADTEDPDV